MNVRAEIEQHAADEAKPALLWLLMRYSRESQWSFVARCTFKRWGDQSYQTHRVWAPTAEGQILYNALGEAQ